MTDMSIFAEDLCGKDTAALPDSITHMGGKRWRTGPGGNGPTRTGTRPTATRNLFCTSEFDDKADMR